MARALWRLGRAVAHVLRGLAVVLWVYPRLDARAREERLRDWSAGLLAGLDIALEVDGTPRPGAKLIVANHVSWLDIVAINAVAPARFVSKAEVRRWPLINRLIDAAGTLYLHRQRRRDAVRVVQLVAQALQAGDTVGVFPEGTTSDGRGLLPFHANLLEAAIATGTPVQPLALRYVDAHEPVSQAPAYVGDVTLVGSLWRVVRADGLRIRLSVLPAEGSRHLDRRALSERVRGQIEARLAAHDGRGGPGGPGGSGG